MAELEEKLNAILNDPQAMGQILSAAKALSGQEEAPGGENDTTDDPLSALEASNSSATVSDQR